MLLELQHSHYAISSLTNPTYLRHLTAVSLASSIRLVSMRLQLGASPLTRSVLRATFFSFLFRLLSYSYDFAGTRPIRPTCGIQWDEVCAMKVDWCVCPFIPFVRRSSLLDPRLSADSPTSPSATVPRLVALRCAALRRLRCVVHAPLPVLRYATSCALHRVTGARLLRSLAVLRCVLLCFCSCGQLYDAAH
ncbi:hypothetical protein B0H12DRAFT_285582 [Mycena haematopus]|nr:hypothetical protein B0H12DRAFT_285582 [Mycena haematopus]